MKPPEIEAIMQFIRLTASNLKGIITCESTCFSKDTEPNECNMYISFGDDKNREQFEKFLSLYKIPHKYDSNTGSFLITLMHQEDVVSGKNWDRTNTMYCNARDGGWTWLGVTSIGGSVAITLCHFLPSYLWLISIIYAAISWISFNGFSKACLNDK